MKRNKIAIIFLIIIWLSIIFYFSHQDATQSSRLSGKVAACFAWIESIVDIDADLEQSLHNIIRKLAHFIEYFVLGGLFYLLYERIGISFVSSVICAIFDETHQYFIPGRGPGVFDVLIDSLGALAGILLVVILMYYAKRKDIKTLFNYRN